jgi:hypothetical protein
MVLSFYFTKFARHIFAAHPHPLGGGRVGVEAFAKMFGKLFGEIM